MNTRSYFFMFSLIIATGCSASSSNERSPANQDSSVNFATETPSAPGELQTLPRDAKFAQLMSALNFNARGATWEYKTSGTSLGLKLLIDKKKIGKWLPANGAANSEAQVVAYLLGRYLQMSENVAPSAYFTLRGAALDYFGSTMQNHDEHNRWREENRENLLRAYERDPSQMAGAFTDSPSTYEVEELENTDANTINTHHPIAQFVRGDGPMPSSTNRMSLKGVRKPGGPVATETELELAREFSKIMILDALTAQWDRWSGGNLEAAIGSDGTRVYFIARDNGGASMSSGSTERSLALVTRFDRQQIEQVKRLATQLADPQLQSHLVSLLQLHSSPKTLLARAQAVLMHVEKQTQRYGAQAFFP